MEHDQTASRMASRRWTGLVLGLLLLAVVAILVLKGLGGGPSAGLAVAEQAAAATLPELAPAATAASEDPFPGTPEAQVDWVLRNGEPALVSFHSNNCKPCIAMTALLHTVWPQYAGELILIDVLTNDVANAGLVRRAGVRSIPTTLFVDASGQTKGYVGLMKEADLRAELDRLLTAE